MNMYDKLDPDKILKNKSTASKNIVLMYDDTNNKLEDCDIDTVKKLLKIYFSIRLETIQINNIEIKNFNKLDVKFKNAKFNNDVLKRGTLWLQFENKERLSNDIYIYIGIGYIKNLQNCIIILWNDNINKNQCYYIINKSSVFLLKNMNISNKLSITNLLNFCFNELLDKKQILDYTKF